MNNTIMTGVLCGHSGKEGGFCEGELQYYKEKNFKDDFYFCQDCYRLTQWNGKIAVPVGGIAYPNSERK